MRLLTLVVGFVAVASGLGLSGASEAATCTWSGASSASWNVAGNWSCAAGPTTGDSLVFPDGAANKAMVQNIANLSVSSIAFTGSSGGYSLTGSGNLTITGAAAITSKAARPNVNTLALTNAINFSAASATIDTSVTSGQGGELDLNGPMNLNGSVLTFVWDATVPHVVINAPISGSGGLTINGSGSDVGLTLSGNSSFTGPVVINGGDVELLHANALGAGGSLANGTTVGPGGTIVIGVDIPDETLTLEMGSGQGGNGIIQVRDAYVWGGPVTLNGDGSDQSFFNLLGTRLTFSGAVVGTGGIDCCNSALGEIVLTGIGKSYSGSTRFDHGAGGVLRIASNGALSPNSPITLGGAVGSVLDMAGFSAAAGALSGGANSTLKIAAGQTLTVNGSVALGGMRLNLSASGSPALGTVFTIIDKTSAGAVTGTFFGLPQGASVVSGGVAMTISYVGGNGNDVTLTVVGFSTVSVTKVGAGTGTVSETSGLISCGASCSGSYPVGAVLSLTATPSAGSIFTGWLGPCTGAAVCTFTVGAATTATATFAPNTSGPLTIDVDGSSTCLALTDGLMAIRHMLGLSGSALIGGGTGPLATRTTFTQVDSFFDNFHPVFDIDGNGAVDAATDGVLLSRYLFGLRGTSLVANATGPGATRNTAAIEAYVAGRCVGSVQLAFQQQPTNVNVRSAIAPTVTVATVFPNLTIDTSKTGTVTLTLGANPGAAVLSGTTSAPLVNGVATFSGLTLDNEGSVTLIASRAGMLDKASAPFLVTDNIPPGAVSDFVAFLPSITTSSITLEWTAPGDDGVLGDLAPAAGPKGSYRLCHSTSPIVNPAVNCTVSTVPGVPIPSSIGFPESITVGSLAPNTLYYFALVVIDGAGLKSAAFVQATTAM